MVMVAQGLKQMTGQRGYTQSSSGPPPGARLWKSPQALGALYTINVVPAIRGLVSLETLDTKVPGNRKPQAGFHASVLPTCAAPLLVSQSPCHFHCLPRTLRSVPGARKLEGLCARTQVLHLAWPLEWSSPS